MKFLSVPTLVEVNDWLSEIDIGDFIVTGRLEAYSCKRAGSDRKLYKTLTVHLKDSASGVPTIGPASPIAAAAPGPTQGLLMPHSVSPGQPQPFLLGRSPPSPDLLSTSPFGPLSLSSSRTTFIHLIAILNSAFPDYDFSDSHPEHFRKEEMLHQVMNSVDTTFAASIPDYGEVRNKMWTMLDREVQLQHCDIYTFIPALDDDPFAEDGSIWSFNYFFYNKVLKRIIFFTCRCLRKSHVTAGVLVDCDDREEELPFYYEDDRDDVQDMMA